MSTDRYTKFVLTVIALSLTVIASDKIYDVLIPQAHAGKTVRCRIPGSGYFDCTPVVVGQK